MDSMTIRSGKNVPSFRIEINALNYINTYNDKNARTKLEIVVYIFATFLQSFNKRANNSIMGPLALNCSKQRC